MNTHRHILAASALALAGLSNTLQADPPQEALPMPLDPAAKIAEAITPKPGEKADEMPKFEDVSKDFVQVVSTTDGVPSFYTLWTRAKDSQMLAELPRNFESQKLFIAYTIAAGIETAGVQSGDMYAYWKRYDKQLAL